jgi:hypothetical protein
LSSIEGDRPACALDDVGFDLNAGFIETRLAAVSRKSTIAEAIRYGRSAGTASFASS